MRNGSSKLGTFTETKPECAPAFKQCGGTGYTGTSCCQAGCICAETDSEYYMQCEPPDVNGSVCDASKAKRARGEWTDKSKIAKEQVKKAEKGVDELTAEKNRLTKLVAKLKKEAQEAEEDLEKKKQRAVDARLAHAEPPQEEGCAKEFQNCGTDGNPGCCQSGCLCDGDEYFGMCKTSDGSGTCLETITSELAANLSAKEAELDTSQQTHDEKQGSLKENTSKLKEVTKKLAKAEDDLKSKSALAANAAKHLADWKEATENPVPRPKAKTKESHHENSDAKDMADEDNAADDDDEDGVEVGMRELDLHEWENDNW